MLWLSTLSKGKRLLSARPEVTTFWPVPNYTACWIVFCADKRSAPKDMATSRQWCTSFLVESSCRERRTPSLRNRRTLCRHRSRRHRSALPSSRTALPAKDDFERRRLATRWSCSDRSMPAWTAAAAAEKGDSATVPPPATCRLLETHAGRSSPWRHHDVICNTTCLGSSLILKRTPLIIRVYDHTRN